jgi:predicted GNAT superfamily acetyltransferase
MPEIRELSDITDCDAVVALYDSIWQPDPRKIPVSAEMMRALSFAGNYVAGAYLDGELVGATVAFLGTPAGRVLHSHVTGVSAKARGHSVGFALKQHQREWASRHGIDVISWTFDPLVRRNAYFNLVKLGASVSRYLIDFYGPMGDGINGSDASDRLLVEWRIADPPADSGDPDGTGLVATPADIETLRRTDPAAAAQWRMTVRDRLSTVRIVGFTRDGSYIVRRRDT